MGGEHSRRRFLSAGAAVSIAPLASIRSTARESLPNTLEIESEGGGVAAYEFTVSGSLEQVDWDDTVEGNWGYGHVGPDRGTDTFSYSGDMTGFVLAGPATAYRDGVRVRSAAYPNPEGTVTSGDFPPSSGTNVLRIESDGGGVAAYEFEVTGALEQVDWDDTVVGNWGYGHLGPDRGTDEFEFTGDVTRFDLAGPASVYLNDAEVTPGSGGSAGDRGLVNVSPASEVTAVPDSLVLFEAVAPDHLDGYLSAEWYVDGQRWIDPGAFHGQLGGPGRIASTCRFEEPGTHDVRLEAYERTDSGKGDHVGTLRWTVAVGENANRPPAVELTSPEEPISVGDSPDRRTFEVTASDPEGDLDRVVWWLTQCDAMVAVSNVAGEHAEASISYAPEQGCPLAVRAIDADGTVSRLYGWDVE